VTAPRLSAPRTSARPLPQVREPRHRDKVVLVTGGGSGIGLETARRFHSEAAHVVLLGRNAGRLESLARSWDSNGSGGDVTFEVCDVAAASSVNAAVAAIQKKTGRIDVLVNNAGSAEGSVDAESAQAEANFRARLEIDVMGSLLMSRAVAPMMAAAGGGAVLNMGSVYAYGGAHGAGSYSAAKGAIVALTRTLATEFGPYGIRVNSVSPGWVDVEKWDEYFSGSTLDHLRTAFARVPLRRAVHASEIASVYSFLASDDASAISGQDIVVDGGMSADLHIAPTIPGL
jgi:NAD(P)-dependent dehydrogenase (short-subunit alcohol dehydrogenase family)